MTDTANTFWLETGRGTFRLRPLTVNGDTYSGSLSALIRLLETVPDLRVPFEDEKFMAALYDAEEAAL